MNEPNNPNIYQHATIPHASEQVTILYKENNIRIERIQSCHASTDWMDQEETEWITILEGQAQLEFEDKVITLQKGDTHTIQPHLRHRVASTSETCLWLCVFHYK